MATVTQMTSDATLPKAYQPAEVERALYERWLAADVFAPDGRGSRADAGKEPFVIIQPPPNVTGALHLGHAARATTEDLMIRRARMQGRPTLWLPGLDHASIAAEWVLNRILLEEGTSRRELGRERYLERMRAFVAETREVITRQHWRIGASLDWSRLRFTMDEGSARAVRTSFKQLYDAGLAYRAEALINWCPGCGTSISDLEVIANPENGSLWTVRYHLVRDDGTPDGGATIEVATTRPETILGDTAVAVHPDDVRYAGLIGRRASIPFVDRVVPIIADDVVDPAFETGRRHGLPTIDVMNDDGTISAAGGVYAGLGREEARRRIVADLEARGDLVAVREHELNLGRCQRSDDVVEPRLKTQWFVRTRPMADRATAAVREGRTRIVPPRLEKVFFGWMDAIHDWNVSRQLWWGHRIPAWYCPDGHVSVSAEEDGPDACDTCGRGRSELRQEQDIFDTWYSSGLWPFSTLGWPDETEDLRRFYPGSVMETGYDILFFWVARMMMLGDTVIGTEPFRTVYLSGLIRDPYGQKMSKTKGNVVDPLQAIEEIGADALRFALIDGTTAGADSRLGQAKLEGARNFGNKLWNAARFVLASRPASVRPGAPLELPPPESLGPAERWILARCRATIAAVDEANEAFRFGEATRLLHEAIWSEYCDWYLEIAKVQLGGTDDARRESTWWVLVWVLDRYLRLLHPVMPFITESIWGRLPHAPDDPELLIVAAWPDADAATGGSAAEPGVLDAAGAVEDLLALIRAIRAARADAGIEAASWLEARLVLPDPAVRAAYEALADAFARLARVRVAEVLPETLPAGSAGALTVLAGAMEARLDRGDADLERERARLQRELEEARGLLRAAETRLANDAFVSRAPMAVVDAARARAAELAELVARLEERERAVS
jgi:valyl-tRNA synthetase